LQSKGIFLDFWVQEVDPSLTALLSISLDVQILVELICNLAPLLGSVFPDQLDELFILPFDPV
jgi:hypothetical protein